MSSNIFLGLSSAVLRCQVGGSDARTNVCRVYLWGACFPAQAGSLVHWRMVPSPMGASSGPGRGSPGMELEWPEWNKVKALGVGRAALDHGAQGLGGVGDMTRKF